MPFNVYLYILYIIPFPLPFSIYSVRRAVAATAAAAVNIYVDVIIVDFVGTGFDVSMDARNLLPQCHFVQLPPRRHRQRSTLSYRIVFGSATRNYGCLHDFM